MCIRDRPECVEDAIIASVVPNVMYSFVNGIKKSFNTVPIIVGPGIKTGIKLAAENPKEVEMCIRDRSKAWGKMGHGDIILIGDVGCPFPRHEMTTCIDLAVTDGVPKVTDVLKTVLDELVVEEYIVSEETKSVSPAVYEEFKGILAQYDNKGNALKETTDRKSVV